MWRATLVELNCKEMKKQLLKTFHERVSSSIQLGMLLLKEKYLKHEVRNKCNTPGD